MTTPAGPTYLTAHLAMKHPIIAAAAVCIPLISWSASDPNVGYVLFTFDDVNASDYTIAYPTLIDNGFPATVYVTDNNVGKDGHMSRAQINLLQEWEIGYHTISHPYLTQLNSNDIKNEVGVATSEIKSFASPYGDFNDEVINAIKEAGYASHVNAWSADGQDGINQIPLKDPYSINRLTMRSDMSYQEVCDMAPESDKALILLFHRIVPNDYEDIQEWDVTQETFEKIVECFEGYNSTTVSKLVDFRK